MLKKAIYAIVIVGISYGAWFAYGQVDFGDRTAVFFERILADEDESDGFHGRGRFERRMPSGGETTPTRELGERGTPTPGDSATALTEREPTTVEVGTTEFRRRGQGGRGREMGGSGRGGRDGGHGRHGGANVSLEDVGYYTLLLAFAAMATFLLDSTIKRTRRTRQTRTRKPNQPASI